jgi:histidinol-phosphate/aromatic aminotransferase/cobyric acid decarboxylase-like protein
VKPLEAITTVYSYYLPEMRELITRLTRDYPHEVFLRSIKPGLDDFHVPIIDRLTAVHARSLPRLGEFGNRYPTAGSEEGIREYMTYLRSQGVESIYVWTGDYEGYREVAKTRGLTVLDVTLSQDPAELKPGYWFLSNPSARHGQFVPEAKIQAVLEAGHKVFYDLSYLSSTAPHVYDLGHPNLDAVAISFSKPFGLFYYRIGFLYSRAPVPVLYANKWFKNVFGLIVADRVLQELDLPALASRYKRIQAGIVNDLNRDTGLGLSASDAFLLAHIPKHEADGLDDERQEIIGRFQRGDYYRFCLTPYFEAAEKKSK